MKSSCEQYGKIKKIPMNNKTWIFIVLGNIYCLYCLLLLTIVCIVFCIVSVLFLYCLFVNNIVSSVFNFIIIIIISVRVTRVPFPTSM